MFEFYEETGSSPIGAHPARGVREERMTVAATKLNADQLRAVEHASGPLLVLAGPGIEDWSARDEDRSPGRREGR